MTTLASCTVLMALACVLPAQFQDRATLQSNLERHREEKLKSAAREDRLHEIFYRHALGLPVDVTQFFAMTKAEEAGPKAQAEQELRRIQKDAKGLVKEYEALRLRIKKSQEAFASKAKKPNPNGFQPLVPAPTAPRRPRPRKPRVTKPRHVPRQPTRRSDPDRRKRPVKPVFLVKGSRDRSLVGRILFRAGKYEHAIRELKPLATGKEAALIDLFHLALSYEKLGRKSGDDSYFAKANDIFSRIEARDSREGTDGKPIMGRWGEAARTARQTMLWILDRGDWKPSRDVTKIRWEKEEVGAKK